MRNFNIWVLIVLISFISCSKKKKEEDTFSSVQNLYVEYVAGYTNGFISSQSEIRVKLTKTVDSAEPGKEILDNLFVFEPSIKGKAFWEDKSTVVFKPDDQLNSGQEYKVRFLLSSILDTPPDKEEFKFVFDCIPQNYEVNIDGISLYDAENLGRVKVVGYIQTADFVTDEDVERIIGAEQEGKALEITFEHSTGQNKHNFVIENASRKEEPGSVLISWDGQSIGVDKSGNLRYDIPSLSDYTVTTVKIVRSGDNYISVLFSDPIDERQNLRGLVRLSQGTNPRVLVDLNELKIYPTSKMVGSVQLNIDKAIKNRAGYTLKEHFQSSLQFSQYKPEVKMAANEGTIMPSSEGLIIPFEAVSLSAVDLTIVRIFENNVLQYLQNNKAGGNYEIRRVGKPIARKTIQLSTTGVTDLNSWNRYTLDISEYINVEPGAFYQVRLNFRKSYSQYFCESAEEEIAPGIEEDWEYEENTNWDYYDDYYYYDWENRDNPCHKAYYTRRRMVNKIVFSSDLGLLAKRADRGKLSVFVSDIVSTEPMTDVSIEAYDYQQQLIGSGNTDGQGKLTLDAEGGVPFVLLAKKDNQYGYLKLDDGSALSLSNFNVSGSRIQKGIKGFVYTERGVWRPGDDIHISFILEDIQDRLPDGHPVILELYNPLGQLHSRSVQSSSLKDLYVFNINTPSDAPTGNWQGRVKVGGATFSKQLKIETVKPNRLKINLDFGKERLIAGESNIGNLNVRWLHGAVARNLKATYEVLLVPTKTTFAGYENLVFDDPSREFFPEAEVIFEGRLDNEGNANMPVRLQTGSAPPGMVNAIFRGKVFEEGGDFSVDKTTIPYVPYDAFVGIQTPEGDKRGMLVTDSDHNIRVVTVDARGEPITRSSLSVELYKLRWRWWWDNSYESQSNYTGRYNRELVKSGTVSTREGEGVYKLRVNQPEWGRYLLRITDPVSGHSSGKIIYIDWPGWAGKQRGELGGASMLDFEIESEEVSVGDQVKINIPSSEGGRALVSLETGSEVLETFWVETMSESTTVEFEASNSMAPNVYAHITLLQPHSQTSNDLPIRMYGVQSIKVTDPETVLKPQITMKNELSPGEKFDVRIEESNGKPMVYTIAIVEDGLLDLTKFKTPEPHGAFYAREALGVKTWDVFDDVIGSYGGQIERLLSVGGDDELEGPEENEANRFKPVIMFKGPFYLESGDDASHSFEMPQYIGSVRTMVVAGYEGAYGSSEKTSPVVQPLMILATLPRVAGPTEDISLPVNIFSMDENIKNVRVKVETSGKITINGPDRKEITFNGTGDQVTYFNLKAAPDLGVAKVRLTATSGKLTAEYDVELQVRASNPEISQVSETIISGGQNWELDYTPLGLLSTNEAVIEISSLPPLNLEQRLKFLIRYPHGCIEQTTSAVFAQLFLDDLVELDPDRSDKIQTNINAAIERLRSFQLPSGAFSYWPGNSEPSYWGTNYAGHFLIEARDKGYLVPGDIITQWTSFQLAEANSWSQRTYSDHLTQTYRLYALAKAGTPALGAMNRLKENTSLSKRAKWSLASAYAVAGYEQAAEEIIAGLTTVLDNYRELGGTYGSTQRDQAMILETMVNLNRQTDAFELVKQISEYMGKTNRWMSTQTTAYCLIGIAKFANQFPPGDGINVNVTVSGNDFRIDGVKYLNQITLIEPDKNARISVSNSGENPVFARLIKTGVPLEGAESQNESNIKMEVVYKDLQGNRINYVDISQGTDFMAEITVTNPGLRGDYEELAITQIFPSGWEIINTRLDDMDQYYQEDKPEYQDVRDDRVMTYFDLKRSSSKTFRVLLNASYQGKYYLPAVYVEAMYDNSITANTVGGWISVDQEK